MDAFAAWLHLPNLVGIAAQGANAAKNLLDRQPSGGHKLSSTGFGSSHAAALAAGAGAAAGATLLAAKAMKHREAIGAALSALLTDVQGNTWREVQGHALPFAAISFVGFDTVVAQPPTMTAFTREPITGLEFPTEIDGKALSGLGIRNKVLFGLKNIRVYAYGVYANAPNLHAKLAPKYANIPPGALAENKFFYDDVIGEDTELAVRLVIYYKGLKIGQVRSAFEDSIGQKLKHFAKGEPNEALLHSFTKQFKDELKLQRGTVIDITRKPGFVLHTDIDGKHVGSVKSALLCQAFFDLYIGQDAFDKHAREAAGNTFAKVVTHLSPQE
eukprot:jgi/Mesen1/5198/ME000258S04288